jgi:DUF2075 family protein
LQFDIVELTNWLSEASIPTVITFEDDYVDLIFGHKMPAVILFRSDNDTLKAYNDIFEDAAINMRGNILFIVSDIKEGA